MAHAPRFELALTTLTSTLLFISIATQALMSNIDQVTIYQG